MVEETGSSGKRLEAIIKPSADMMVEGEISNLMNKAQKKRDCFIHLVQDYCFGQWVTLRFQNILNNII